MKDLTARFSMAVGGITMLIAAAPAMAQGCGPDTTQARGAQGYPSFCAIPQVPRDIPSVQVFRDRTASVQAAARALREQSGPSTWTLPEDGAAAFASQARAQAAAPPAQSADADAEAYAAHLRELARPPARPR